MTRLAIALALVALPRAAWAQPSIAREVDLSAGYSTEELSAGGVQVRLFGPVRADWRIYLEGSWAAVSRNGSDAFGTAYPYDRRLRPMETYVEKTIRPRGVMVGVRAGRYRTPFGIHGRADHGYQGFVRAPLVRYGDNWALSNVALEAGTAVLVGVPALSIEASVGVPYDGGHEARPRTVDTVVRAQGFYRSLIVGASYLDSKAHREGPWVRGRMVFAGVDARWMHGGVLVRGEWIAGRPWSGVATRGGYIDLVVHRIGMGPITAVARADRLDYDAGPRSSYQRRYTVGARVRLWRQFAVHVNLVHHPAGLTNGRPTAVDLGLGRSLRF